MQSAMLPEGGAKPEKLPSVIYFKAKIPSLLYRQIGDWLKTFGPYPVQELSEGQELFDRYKLPVNALVLLHLNSPEDVIQIEQVIRGVYAREWQWNIQLMVITTSDHPKVFELLHARNCEVILHSVTTLKTMADHIQQKLELAKLSESSETPDFLLQIVEQDKWLNTFKINWADALSPSLIFGSFRRGASFTAQSISGYSLFSDHPKTQEHGSLLKILSSLGF